MKRSLLAAALALLLAGCGGGGGGSSAPAPSPTPAPVRDAPPLLLYFGVIEEQLKETADHVSTVYPMDWGDWDTMRPDIADRIIAQLQEAKALGYANAIVAVGFCMFSKAYVYRGTDELAAFWKRVQAVGLPIVGVSIIDEPDVVGVTDAEMTKAILDAKAVTGCKVFVCYGDTGHGTPGIAVADVVGRDKYPSLVSVPTHPGQQRWLFAGGADPWRADPAPFIAYAKANGDVAAVCAFLWGDGWGGTTNKGIRDNGMAAAYRSAFKSVA